VTARTTATPAPSSYAGSATPRSTRRSGRAAAEPPLASLGVANDRSRRGELQALLGDHGTILPRLQRGSPDRPAQGWYAVLANGSELFLGDYSRLAELAIRRLLAPKRNGNGNAPRAPTAAPGRIRQPTRRIGQASGSIGRPARGTGQPSRSTRHRPGSHRPAAQGTPAISTGEPAIPPAGSAIIGGVELQPIDLRLLGVLGARDGRAKPAELREATGIPPRTLSRALTRLDDAGLLEERSKATVTLSAAGWCLLQPALEVHHKGPQSTRPAPARPPGPDEELGDEDEASGLGPQASGNDESSAGEISGGPGPEARGPDIE